MTLYIWQNRAKGNCCNFANFNRVVNSRSFGSATKVALMLGEVKVLLNVNFLYMCSYIRSNEPKANEKQCNLHTLRTKKGHKLLKKNYVKHINDDAIYV